MTLTIGAIMNEDLWYSFQETGRELGFHPFWLGARMESLDKQNLTNFAGVIIALDGLTVLSSLARPQFLDTVFAAGLPVSPDSGQIADRMGIADVIGGEEDLVAWLEKIVSSSRNGDSAGAGKVIVVWGPHGAPGRTTMAINVAAELSLIHPKVVVVDADTVAPSVAQYLSLPGEVSGLVGAIRNARLDNVSAEVILNNAVNFTLGQYSFGVLTGLTSPGTGRGLEKQGFGVILRCLRDSGCVVVVDISSLTCGLEIETGGSGARCEVAGVALNVADSLAVVSHIHPIGVARFCREWPTVSAAISTANIVGLIRSPGSLDSPEIEEAAAALWAFTGVGNFRFVPDEALAMPWSVRNESGRQMTSKTARKNRNLEPVARDLLGPLGGGATGSSPASTRGTRSWAGRRVMQFRSK